MYELRWYQREAVEAAWSHLKVGAHNGNPVICAPTGSGKSLMIAELARAAVQDYDGRALVLAHRKELLEQNTEKIAALLPFGVTCGIYSAGLNRRAVDDAIVCCGIQSVHTKAAEFGRRHLVIVDEAHLIPETEDGMYRRFLGDLKELNPKLRIVGLTATPYRTGEGTICRDGNIFHKICYTVPIQRLIAEGFLCPIVSTPAAGEVDTSKLHKRGGEFIESEMQELFSSGDNVFAACREIVDKTALRRSVIVFCAGILHAGQVCKMLRDMTGERVELVTGETLPIVRKSHLDAFKRQEIKYLCNVDVLTTGFDAPCIDGIAVLRATASPGLFAQMVGRGLRTHHGKQDCLILDFGENIKRHGPIDSPEYGKKSRKQDRKGGKTSGGDGSKICPNCDEVVAANTRQCECGFIFPPTHQEESSQEQILAKPERWRVLEMTMQRWSKKNAKEWKPDTLRVNYLVIPDDGTEAGEINLQEQTISEWVCLEHDGWAFVKAKNWLAEYTRAKLEDMQIESNIGAAIDLFSRGAFAETKTITTMKDGRFQKIISRELGQRPESWQEPLEPVGYNEWGDPIYDDDPLSETSGLEDAPF